MRFRLRALTAVFALSAACAATAATPAAADEPCTITGFTPRTFTVGLSPRTATFNVQTSDCTLEAWSVEGGFFVHTSAPQETFNPFDNSEAGPQDIIVAAYNSDFDERERVFVNGFSLKRNSGWQNSSFNASPEPVRKGGNITLKGRLLIADWEEDRYAVAAYRTVHVQFRSPNGSFSSVKTVQTNKDGWVTTTVPAKTTGVWRLDYRGNSAAGPVSTQGDSVQVVS